VEALDPNEDSISINFSVDSGRWMDLLFSRLPTALVGADARWRERVEDRSSRTVFVALLERFKTYVNSLQPEHFLPPALKLENRETELAIPVVRDKTCGHSLSRLKRARESSAKQLRKMPRDLEKAVNSGTLQRNPLMSLAAVGSLGSHVHFDLRAGAIRPGFESDFKVDIYVCKGLKDILEILARLNAKETLSVDWKSMKVKVEDKESSRKDTLEVSFPEKADIEHLLSLLMFNGYLLEAREV